MATLLGDVATDAQAGTGQAHGLTNARVKANLDSYTIGGSTETSGSTIDLGGLIPKGARVKTLGLHVTTNQSSLTFKLGDDADDDRYVASGNTSLQTAGLYEFSGKNYQVGTTSGDDQIVLTTGGATMTAGQLEFYVEYTMN